MANLGNLFQRLKDTDIGAALLSQILSNEAVLADLRRVE